MKIKRFLAAICLTAALCTPAFSDSGASQPCCGSKIHLRKWAKAVFKWDCKCGPFCVKPPEPPAAPEPAKEAPKDAAKTDTTVPAPAAPVPNKTP